MPKYYQGRFRPKNPKKYVGDVNNIVYRSSWELKFMSYCDKHPGIIKWGSEELQIPYKSPIDRKIHRYFPDFIIQKKDADGKIQTIMIEIKPKKYTTPPNKAKAKSKTGRRSVTYLNEVKTWGVNEAKWKSAKEFCDDRGWKFQVMTEDHLGIK